ncbi:hypothetical protein D3C80_1840520 [compost metagenome]
MFQFTVSLYPGLFQADKAGLVEISCQGGLGLHIQITGGDLIHRILIKTGELGPLLLQLLA